MREALALPLLLFSISFPPAASEAVAEPDPSTWVVVKLDEGKEGILGSQLGDGQALTDLELNQFQISPEHYKKKKEAQRVRRPQLNRKTDTILDTIEAIAVGETSHHDEVVDLTENGLEINQKALDILDQIREQQPDAEGRKCVKKIMMRQETVYEEVMTCHHRSVISVIYLIEKLLRQSDWSTRIPKSFPRFSICHNVSLWHRGAFSRFFLCMKPPLIGPFCAWKPLLWHKRAGVAISTNQSTVSTVLDQ